MNKKLIAFLSILSLFLSLPSIPVSAAVKAGEACTKVGMTSIASGKTYTCIKSGKKLVWDKGVPTKVTAGSTCPKFGISQNYNEKKFTCIKSGKKLVWDKGVLTVATASVPSNFSDLYEKRNGISYAVWNKIHLKLMNTNIKLPLVEVYRGPSTPVYVKDPAEYFKFVAQVFSEQELPKKIVVFYWSHADMSSVAAKALSIMGSENDQKHTSETTGPFVDCYTPVSCDVGHAFIGLDGVAYIGIGVPDTIEEAKRAAGGFGGVEVVEFYHSLNLFPYYVNSLSVVAPKQNTHSSNLPPTWLSIGSENVMSAGLAYKNDLNNFTKVSGKKYWIDEVITGFDLEWLNNYLSIDNLAKSWSDSSLKNSKTNVIMGTILTEIFVAIKGPSVMLDIHDQMSKKNSFTDAFQNIFGISWESAKPELVKVIYDRYVNNY